MGVTFVLALAAALPAVQQEPANRGPESAIFLIPRFSDLAGDLDTDLDLDYSDLWGGGFGLHVEYDLLFPLKKGWKMGLYFSTGFDVFSGDTATDDVGDTLEADPLSMVDFLVGFKAMLAPAKGFFLDGRLGFGAVSYGETEGELTIGGLPIDVVILDATTVFGAEFAAHVGFATSHVLLGAGFCIRSQGAPDEGDLAFEGTSAAVFASFELEIGFRF